MIPVNNLYYLLLYAWDAFEEGRMTAVDAEPETDLLNLLAAVLCDGIDQLLRRGADRGYLPIVEAIPGIRGKLEIATTVKAQMLPRAQTICQFDELSYDVPHNQILKATLRQLLQSPDLDRKLHAPIRFTYHRLAGITDIRLSERVFHSVQLHRNIRFYRFLLDVCRLIYDCLIPDEATGKFRFPELARDEKRMRRVFERFLFNFYRHEQSAYRVRSNTFPWARVAGAPAHIDLLPTMRTDVTLIGPDRRVVIDAKYYVKTLQTHHGKPSLRSGHLYQLFTYLKNLPPPHNPNLPTDGMLIYPLVDRPLDLHYTMHGHGIRIYTLNLNQHWRSIKHDLLRLLPALAGTSRNGAHPLGPPSSPAAR
jgi:5-methylcytosine-specific restriction enzyme subunit McrC